MFLTEPDQILPAGEWFTSRVGVKVNTKAFTLADDVIDFIICQIQPVPIVRSPTAGAVEIADRSGFQQDCPGNVALVFLAKFLLAPPSDQNGFDEEVNG